MENTWLDPSAWHISAGDIITFSSIIFAALSLVHQHMRALDVQKVELYHRLETSSIELFKFEADNARVLEKFQDVTVDELKFADEIGPDGQVIESNFGALQAGFESMEVFVEKHFCQLDADKSQLKDPAQKRQFEKFEQERLVARKFYEQTLNLFEMATRFRNKKIIEPEVFGSWVIWFYDTLVQWSFRDHWRDLRQNYTPDLRAVFNRFIDEFDPSEEDEVRKRRFFQHVSEITRCPVIRDWLGKIELEGKQFPRLRLPSLRHM